MLFMFSDPTGKLFHFFFQAKFKQNLVRFIFKTRKSYLPVGLEN